jgi:hypothetical protein
MQKIILSLFLSVCFSSTSFALVDYSAEENVVPNRPQKKRIKRKAKVAGKSIKTASRNSGGSYVPTGMFDVTFGYSTISVETDQTASKVNVMEFNGHFETGASIYFDAKYWMADTSSELLSSSADSQSGNPEIIMGFNWLAFGGGGNFTNIDLLAGVRLASEDSQLGSTRTDKIIGVSTVKRFNQFALGLGYKYYLTGTPGTESELNIGNMSKLSATIGWMVSSDIQFELEGAVFKVSKSDSTTKANVLNEAESIGTISPKLSLRLAQLVNLNLGATFISKQPKNNKALVGANLWDVPGVYGSSINASIAISI